MEASDLEAASLDAELRRLDRLAALGGLTAELVHEIRNPLVSLKTFLQLLRERDPEELRGEFLQVATDELRRIERLLDAVLEQARPAAAGESCAAIRSAVDSVVCLVGHRASAAGVEIDVDVAPDLPAVAVSPDALRQVLLNLLLNAIDATPAGADVAVSARRAQGGVEIRVADRGPGIAATRRGCVFEPFLSTKRDQPGGLGLAISHRIVEEAGGSIEIGDRAGGGACFHVRLPRQAA